MVIINNLTKKEKEMIAEEHQALIYFSIKKFLNVGDYDELESVAMVGFTKALNAFDKDKNIQFSTYAIACIKNEFMHYLREQKKHFLNISMNSVFSTDKEGNSLTPENLIESDIDLNEALLEDEKKEQINRALNNLSAKQKEAVIKFYLESKSYTEIAKEMNCSSANVSQLLNRALLNLKEEINLRRLAS